MQMTRNGDVDIAYEVRGEGPETLLLVMGILMRRDNWGEAFLDALAKRYRVVYFDNRGTGDSTRPVDEISATLWAQDALAVLDAVGVQRAHLLGYSMGGRVAQELVLRYRERFDSVVLLASAIGGEHTVAPTAAAAASFIPDRALSAEDNRRNSMLAICGPGFGESHPDRLQALVRIGGEKRTPLSVLQKQMMVGATSVADELGVLDMPCLVIHGDSDALVPMANGEKLAERIPGAQTHWMRGAGHIPTWEAPEELIDAVLGFLGSAPVTRAAAANPAAAR